MGTSLLSSLLYFFINHKIFLAILFIFYTYCLFFFRSFCGDEDVAFLEVGRWSRVCGHTYSGSHVIM
jgi:hypothetical protein